VAFAGSVQRFHEFELDRAAHELRRRGRAVRLEGRAMSLLMLLLERPGELVTRAEIVARLWGSDAFIDVESGINTAVRKLRAALRDSADHPRVVLTVQGHGYRFIAPLDGAADRAQPDTAGRPRTGNRRLLQAAALAVAVVATALLVALAPRPPAPLRVQVLAFDAPSGNSAARAVADRVGEQIAGVLSETGVQVAPPPKWRLPSLRPHPPDLAIGGGVSEDPGGWHARLFLEDTRAEVILWTYEFTASPSDPKRLAGTAAAAAGNAIAIALEAQQQRGLALDPQTLALFLHASELLRREDGSNPGGPIRALKEVVRREPRFALAQGVLALDTVSIARAIPEVREPYARQAEAEAHAAIRADPAAAGPAYGALSYLAKLRDPADLLGEQRPLSEGVTRAPRHPFNYMLDCDLLTAAGRFRVAEGRCMQALALGPTGPDINWHYVWHLIDSGRYARAAQQLEVAATMTPDAPREWRNRFDIASFSRPPAEARRLLRDPKAGHFVGPRGLAALEQFLTARASGSPDHAAKAARAMAEAVKAEQLGLAEGVTRIAFLGQTQIAFELLETVPPSLYRGDAARFLSSAPVAPLRADPRWWAAAARAGLVKYWMATNTWPDFCDDPQAGVDCRAMAAKASEAGRQAAWLGAGTQPPSHPNPPQRASSSFRVSRSSRLRNLPLALRGSGSSSTQT
jgi:DNA-binding winged helix-turn-helix (wHTH) protein